MEAAKAILQGAIEEIRESGLPELLRTATYRGLVLQDKTLAMVEQLLDRDGENINPKLLRLGNETATALLRSALRAAEGEFQNRKAGALDELLAEIREAKAKRGMVEDEPPGTQEIPEAEKIIP